MLVAQKQWLKKTSVSPTEIKSETSGHRHLRTSTVLTEHTRDTDKKEARNKSNNADTNKRIVDNINTITCTICSVKCHRSICILYAALMSKGCPIYFQEATQATLKASCYHLC